MITKQLLLIIMKIVNVSNYYTASISCNNPTIKPRYPFISYKITIVVKEI